MTPDSSKPIDMTQPAVEVRPLGLRSLVRDSGIGYLGVLAMLALGIVTKILLARALTATEFGLLITAQTIVGLALMLGQLSLPDTVVRFVGLYAGRDMPKAKSVLLNGLRLSILSSSLIALGLVLSANLIAEGIYGQVALASVLVLLALTMPISTAASILASAYRGISQLWVKIAYVDLSPAVLIIAALVLLIIFRGNSLVAVTTVYLVATILSIGLVAGRYLRSPQWRVQAHSISSGELLRYSLPLLGASLVAWPMSAIPLLLGSLESAQSVAYYSLAMSLSSFIYTSVSAAEMAGLPVWSDQIARGTMSKLRADYAFTTRWCFIIGSTIFVILFMYPETILQFLYGSAYVGAAPAVGAIAVVFLINAATGPNESILKAFGSTRWIFSARTAVGVVAIALAFPLIQAWGLAGAVIAYSASSITGFVFYAGYLYWRHHVHPLDGPFLKTLVASAIALTTTALVRYVLGEEIGVWNVLVILLVYGSSLFGLLYESRAFTPQDQQALRNAFHHARYWLSKGRV